DFSLRSAAGPSGKRLANACRASSDQSHCSLRRYRSISPSATPRWRSSSRRQQFGPVPLLTAQVPLDQPFGHTSLAQLLTQTDGTVAPLTARMDIGITEALVAEQPHYLQTVQLDLRHIPGGPALTELAQHLGIAVLPPRQQIQGGSANGHGGIQLAALEHGKKP